MKSFAKRLRAMASNGKMAKVLRKAYEGTKVDGTVNMEQQTFRGKVTEDILDRSGAIVVLVATAGGLYCSLTNQEKADLKTQKEENTILIRKLRQQLSTCAASEGRCYAAMGLKRAK